MKKQVKAVNINFILILSVVCLLVGAALIILGITLPVFAEINGLGNSIQNTVSSGSVDDVEGWGVIMSAFVYALGVGSVFIFVVMMILLFLYAFLLFVPALIARLVYQNSGGRLLAYRILTGFDCGFLLLGAFALFSLVSGEHLLISLLVIIAALAFIGIAVVCMVNTYSNRIEGIEKENH